MYLKLTPVMVIVVAVLFTLSVAWSSTAQTSSLKGKRILFHLVTNTKKDDGPFCVAIDLAWVALKEGAQVELMFDSAAAWSEKIYKGKTDWARYDIPQKVKKLMAEQLGEDEKSFPKTYQDLLKMLHDKGAILTINGTWNALTDVEKTVKGRQNIPSYVQPLMLKEMLEHRAKADQYWSF